MNPERVIRQAAVDGVRLALSPPDNIKVIGNENAVDRWLPVIREHKAELLAALGVEPLQDARAEARRQRVLSMLAENRGITYAALTDCESDPEAVLLTLAIREQATCELRIPRDRYDPFLLLDLIERHGATMH